MGRATKYNGELLRRFVVPIFTMVLLAEMSVTGYGATFMGSFNNEQKDGDVVAWVERQAFLGSDEMLHTLRADTTPNTVSAVKTLPSAEITGLSLDIRRFGVIVEPTDKKEITIDLVGVKNPENVKVTTSTAGGVLTVKVDMNKSNGLLISTVKDDLINVVRIGIPAGTIRKIAFEDREGSCILMNDLDIPISGKVANGLARVQIDTLTAAVNMEAANGNVLVRAITVNGPVTMKVANGDASVKAKTVTGRTDLSAMNGSVKLDADSVNNASLTAVNGDVNIKAATIVEKLSAGVANGDLECKLTKQPQNLKFVLNSKGAYFNNVELPQGWRNGYTIGNGKPVLELSVGNGELELEVE